MKWIPAWMRTEKIDESIYDAPPEGFEEWDVLDRIEWNMKVMTKRITIGARARKRLGKVVRAVVIGFVILFLLAGLGIWQFVELERTQDDLSSQGTDVEKQAGNVQKQADRNSIIIDCLRTWSEDHTEALQERDVVIKVARSAQREMWRRISYWLKTAPQGADRRPMLEAIARFQSILKRLDQTTAINPYPEINECLDTASAIGTSFRLMAYGTQTPKCFRKDITIHGTPDNDVLHGTAGPDVIKGFQGDDIIHAERGRDLICGGRGDDTIHGGQDFDYARGQRGSDFCIQTEWQRSC